MPEIARSFVVVIFLSGLIFFFLEKYSSELNIDINELHLRRNVWLLITASAFLANNFWIFSVTTVLILFKAAQKEKNILSLIFFVLFAIPLFEVEIPGFGLVNHWFGLNYFKIISLTLLFPVYISIRKKLNQPRFGHYITDKFILLYIGYQLLLIFPNVTFTGGLRMVFINFIDVFLPYYVASRYMSNMDMLNDSLKSLIIGITIMGLIGIFEFSKGWLLYSRLEDALDVPVWGYGSYLVRDNTVRALSSSGQPIVLGVLVMIGIGLFFYVAKLITQFKIKMVIFATLLIAIFAPISRGPWIGLVAVFTIIFVLNPFRHKMIAYFFRITPPALIFLSTTSYGEKILNLLPFFGTVDPESVTFRQRLLDNSLLVIEKNLWFGSRNFLGASELESLRAGGNGGIIDIVNSYIGILLFGGMTGLVIYLSIFFSSLYGIWQCLRKLPHHSLKYQLGVTLIATVAGLLVSLYMVSSITFIPIMCWFLCGLSVGYANIVSKSENSLI